MQYDKLIHLKKECDHRNPSVKVSIDKTPKIPFSLFSHFHHRKDCFGKTFRNEKESVVKELLEKTVASR